MCQHEHASTRTRYDRESAELHCEIVCDACGSVIRLVETLNDYRPRFRYYDADQAGPQPEDS
jgi:transcription initiation factor TFIIIB Brf1 subunit/transcription initiation factor TFIIB